ncbi:CD276 antigen homolog [Labeo rohita]|uniref:CD276 antigen homolog n=1 Tax=Labeo rohita TaxID=84645 RepID=UPI0021E29FA1|nr:CD276 antigen homolog [Labeo rohita]
MIIGWCFICAFAVLINKVHPQVTVVGFTGGSVVLPCSSTEHDLELQDVNVLWRHNGSEPIYDLIRGEHSVTQQNPRYKNRAKTFPEEYLKGNFSIKLNNLTHNDAGEFSCFITHLSDSKQETVWLIINESTVEKENNSTEHTNQEPETKPDRQNIFVICLYIILILIITVPIITCFVFHVKNVVYGAQAPVYTEGTVSK